MALIVSTIGTASRNYSTIAAWAAGLPANLVTAGNSYEGDCYNDSEFVSSSQVLNLTGHTTDASHTILLTTGAGQSFRDNANVQTNALAYNASNGVGIRVTGSYLTAITVANSYTTVSNLQISAIVSPAVALQFTANNCAVSNCVISGNSGTAALLVSGSTPVSNCLITNRHSSGDIIGSDNGNSVYFCTMVAPTGVGAAIAAGIGSTHGSSALENCAIFGCTAVGSGTNTYTTCMTDVASPPTGCTQVTYANQFVSTANDWREKTGANLHGAGTADATHGAVDIAGTARPQGGNWDIGCWELVAAAVSFIPFEPPRLQIWQ